jgi:hypothetical protein
MPLSFNVSVFRDIPPDLLRRNVCKGHAAQRVLPSKSVTCGAGNIVRAVLARLLLIEK